MEKTGTFRKIISRIRYHLIIHVLINRLAKRGIIICPFYLFKVRQLNSAIPPAIRDNDPVSYRVEILKKEDVSELGSNNPFYIEAQLRNYFDNGVLVIGVKHNQSIVTSHMLNLNECDFDYYRFKLKNNEAYGFGLFTLESYKGKNLAAFQAYYTFEILKQFNKDAYYFINDYFNRSTLRVTRKYNARPVKLLIHISLFKKFKCTRVLKTYPEPDFQ